jgi:lysophospholipase L1-like esterase
LVRAALLKSEHELRSDSRESLKPQGVRKGSGATKIVALGDSLTVGETGFTFSPADEPVAPYPKCLELLAGEYLRGRQSRVPVEVLNRGVNGDLTSGMLERFSRDVVETQADYVIILGGSNDIGWGLDPTSIAYNLSSMYEAALNKGIRAVACSVPSILGFDELIAPRLGLNRLIRAEAEKRKMPFIDLFMATADPRNNRLSEDYSADGLHLNSKGYERTGKYIFDKWLKAVLDQHL